MGALLHSSAHPQQFQPFLVICICIYIHAQFVSDLYSHEYSAASSQVSNNGN